MRKGGSPSKGGGFERLICRKFTKWLTGNDQPEVLWRSATSGAKATQDAKAGRHLGLSWAAKGHVDLFE